MTPPPIIYAAPQKSGCSTVWRILALIFLALLVISVFGHLISFSRAITPHSHTGTDKDRSLDEVVIQSTNSENKIAVINVDGIITSRDVDHSEMNLPDYISEQLKSAGRDSDVKAVILKVNSPGGEVLASDDINAAIRKFQDDTHKPVIASMGTLAASGGYYISAPCRWIVANPLTLTGSIGVIMDSYNYRGLLDKIGVRPQVFKSGRFKDMLSGEKEPDTNNLSADELKTRREEHQMVQDIINETYGRFKEVVRTGRGAAATENKDEGHALAPDWQDYADGRVLTGTHALKLGFVDELGGFDVAVKRAEKLAGIPSASLVEYKVQFDLQGVLSHLFGKTSVPAIKIDMGFGPPALEAGRLYYILPTTVLH